jgi:ABC-type branched-subunit amino acid transport system permease subunit
MTPSETLLAGAVGRAYRAIRDERVAIAAAVGVKVPTARANRAF